MWISKVKTFGHYINEFDVSPNDLELLLIYPITRKRRRISSFYSCKRYKRRRRNHSRKGRGRGVGGFDRGPLK